MTFPESRSRHITLNVWSKSTPAHSGCLNSFPPTTWVGGLCVSGALPPSTSVVTKTYLSQMIGWENPRPGSSTFHRTFLVSFHSIGRFLSVETPWLSGPRHCGQLLEAKFAVVCVALSSIAAATLRQM